MAVEPLLATRAQRAFIVTISIQAIVVLVMVGITFRLVEMQIEFNTPSHINESDIPKTFRGYAKSNVYLGYRHMCRFFSGEVFKHPALAKYDYYWRLDDDSGYFCPVEYDVFKFMQKNSILYGWAIYFFEMPVMSGQTLWETSLEYIEEKKIKVGSRFNDLKSIWGDYHRCHFWNNFEVLDLNFFRSKTYQDYYNYLDKKGGFYYNRWGDALVRTIALHMLLPDDTPIHHFGDIGYIHQDFCQKECDPSQNCIVCEEGVHSRCRWSQRYFRGVETSHVIYLLSSLASFAAIIYFCTRRRNQIPSKLQ